MIVQGIIGVDSFLGQGKILLYELFLHIDALMHLMQVSQIFKQNPLSFIIVAIYQIIIELLEGTDELLIGGLQFSQIKEFIPEQGRYPLGLISGEKPFSAVEEAI